MKVAADTHMPVAQLYLCSILLHTATGSGSSVSQSELASGQSLEWCTHQNVLHEVAKIVSDNVVKFVEASVPHLYQLCFNDILSDIAS